MSTILELADFFGTSVDVLLGYQMQSKSREALLEKVKYYIHHKDLSVPFVEIEKALKRFPNDFDISYRCATLYEVRSTESHNHKHYLRALELYEEACRLIAQNTNPEISLTSIRVSMAQIYRAFNKEKAVALLKENNPCGVNNALIGEILACTGKGEDAVPYLSRAMLDVLNDQFSLAIGFMNVYCHQGRHREVLAVMDWLETAITSSKLPGQITYLDRMLSAFTALRAYACYRLGQEDTARDTLRLAKAKALAFDAAPDYSATRIRFVVIDAATAYDDFGTTALDSVGNMVDMQEEPGFTALWQEVLHES